MINYVLQARVMFVHRLNVIERSLLCTFAGVGALIGHLVWHLVHRHYRVRHVHLLQHALLLSVLVTGDNAITRLNSPSTPPRVRLKLSLFNCLLICILSYLSVFYAKVLYYS